MSRTDHALDARYRDLVAAWGHRQDVRASTSDFDARVAAFHRHEDARRALRLLLSR